jgi:hexosaminidase
MLIRHITDSQSWPLDLDAFPELARAGAYPGQTYSQAQVQALIQYAGEVSGSFASATRARLISARHRRPPRSRHARTHRFNRALAPRARRVFRAPVGALRARPAAGGAAAVRGRRDGRMGAGASARARGGGAKRVCGSGRGRAGGAVYGECRVLLRSADVQREDAETQRDLAKKGWTLDDALDRFVNETHAPIWAASKTSVVWQEMVRHHALPPLPR